MQPHQPRARSRAGARAAARTLYQDTLAWLRGYPLGPAKAGAIPWSIVVEPGRPIKPAVISITPEHLRRAAHGVHRLSAEFPRAVRSMLEDPAGWCGLASRRIESLALFLQGKRAIPDLAALLDPLGLPRAE